MMNRRSGACPGRWFVIGALFLAFFLQGNGLPAQVSGNPAVPVPVRVVAAADVEALPFGRYVVREYLDVHNDGNRFPLEVRQVTADSWVGRRIDRQGEAWFSGPPPLLVPPATIVRVAERQRIVAGRPKRNWWVRWVRFTVETDRGVFPSNFIASPLKPPGHVTLEESAPTFDSQSAPGLHRPR